jgi:hypothetical protein
MRRIVAALVLISVAFALSACGGAAPEATTNATTSDIAAPPPAAVAGAAQTTDTKSPVEVAKGEQFPTQADQTPKAILDHLAAKRPILLFFYDSTQLVTREQRAEVDAVMSKYRGLIELVAYDVRAGNPSDAASKDPEIQKAMGLTGLLGVKFQPYTIFVDRYGRITGRFSGYADEQLLEREVLRATS